MIWVKGALEALLASAIQRIWPDGTLLPLDALFSQVEPDGMASQGLRVLARAYRRAAPDQASLSHADVQEGLILLSLEGMIDPPRPEAAAAIRSCQEASIQVKMITGDHALTATAIARRLGLIGGRGLPDTATAVIDRAARAAESDGDLQETT